MKDFHRNLIAFRAAKKALIKYSRETSKFLPTVAALRVVDAVFERLEKDGYSIVKLKHEAFFWSEAEDGTEYKLYRIIDRKEELDNMFSG